MAKNMNSSELLKSYESMLRLSQDMLALATEGDWDRLVEAEHARSLVEADLKQKDVLAWSGDEAATKETLIRDIVSIDTQTKALVSSGLDELQGKLGSVGTEKRLQKAYGVP